jgi:60 kDa SS-A/Ro ribonucleoprotein
VPHLKRHRTRPVPPQFPIPGSGQIPERAGGDACPPDDWTRLRRFLVLGSEHGSYSASERTLTRASAQALERCIRADGPRAVAEIVRVSDTGRAPRSDPALFGLAMAAGLGDADTRRTALDALPQVARTAPHLFTFAAFVEEFRGWGRSLRRAVGRWYAAQPVETIAYQAVAYRRREGVGHRDLLRRAHPARRVSAGNPTLAVTPGHERLFDWIVRGGTCDGLPRLVEGFVRAQASASPAETARLVAEYRLPREAVRSDHLGCAAVWAALLEDMPMAAMLRSLATMTRVGALAPGSAEAAMVAARLGDAERIRRARLHPVALLAALRTYAAGRGIRGPRRWEPVTEVVDALDAALSTAFGAVEPTGRRLLLALDVSASMAWGNVAGVEGLTPREASAAMALVTAATEPRHEIVGFCAGGWFRDRGRDRHPGLPDGLTRLDISPRRRLEDAVRAVEGLRSGGTDCALPMLYAQALEREVDTFVVYTDSDTWAGDVHPVQALRDYRRASGIDARLVVVGMVSSGFSIADPADAGMLDVLGFDLATPQLIGDFARRAL